MTAIPFSCGSCRSLRGKFSGLCCFCLLPSSQLGARALVPSSQGLRRAQAALEDPGRDEAESLGLGGLTFCSPQVKDCTDHVVLPMDGATLAEVMRQRGINMRYLGKVLDLVLRSPARDQLDHIYVSGAQVGP